MSATLGLVMDVRSSDGEEGKIRPIAIAWGKVIEIFIKCGWNPPPPDDEIADAILDDMIRMGYDVSHPVYDLDSGELVETRLKTRSLELSGQDVRALRLAAEGMTYGEAAKKAGIGVETIRKQMKIARRKLGARNTAHAVAIAIRKGVI